MFKGPLPFWLLYLTSWLRRRHPRPSLEPVNLIATLLAGWCKPSVDQVVLGWPHGDPTYSQVISRKGFLWTTCTVVAYLIVVLALFGLAHLVTLVIPETLSQVVAFRWWWLSFVVVLGVACVAVSRTNGCATLVDAVTSDPLSRLDNYVAYSVAWEYDTPDKVATGLHTERLRAVLYQAWLSFYERNGLSEPAPRDFTLRQQVALREAYNAFAEGWAKTRQRLTELAALAATSAAAEAEEAFDATPDEYPGQPTD